MAQQKNNRTKREVIADLRNLFGVTPEGPSTETEGRFHIEAPRQVVVPTLFAYLERNRIIGGDCSVVTTGDTSTTDFIVC